MKKENTTLEELLLEKHSKEQTMLITKKIGTDKAQISELMNLFFGNEKIISQRAAWVLRYVAESYPELIKKYHKKMVMNLKNEVHDAIKRNTLLIFSEIKIPKNLQGYLTDICFNFLIDIKEKVAIRAHAMKILWNIVQEEPELAEELRIVLEEFVPHGSAGLKSIGNKTLKAIHKLQKS